MTSRHVRRILLPALSVLVLPFHLATAQAPAPVAAGEFRVTPVLGPTPGAYTQAFVIELATRVVLVDAGASRQHADRLLEVVRTTGKPVAAVLLTHGHIDHYGGVGAIRGPSVPLMTGVGVARQIAEYDSLNFARFGAAAPAGNRQPDRILGNGERLTWDGVEITLHDAGPGESYSDVWYMVRGASRSAAMIGDIVMFGIPPFAQSGHTGDWLRSLERLGQEIPATAAIYLGHDRRAVEKPGTPWQSDVLGLQHRRVREFRDAVRARTGETRLLTNSEVEAVTNELLAKATETDPAFRFLYSTSANVVAAELILESQRLEFERLLRTALTTPRRP
jgi:glyoxylase-like metal-dependent hydrolase (beta-lactamase superfamily II)